MSTQCPKCGWYYSADYKPVGEVCGNTAHLPWEYKLDLHKQGVMWPACKGRVVKVKKTLDTKGQRS